MTVPRKLSEQGLEYSFNDRTMGMMRSGVAHFQAPYVISYEGEYQPKEGQTEVPVFNLTAIMMPLRPGWSRMISCGGPDGGGKKRTTSLDSDNAPDSLQTKSKPAISFSLFSFLPKWVKHQFGSIFLDSDLAFLHYQEQERLVKRNTDLEGYCMPAPADRAIVALREWIKQHAFIPTTANVLGDDKSHSHEPLLPASPVERSKLFDRWTQHSDQCKYCHGALDGVKVWRRNTLIAMGASILTIDHVPARIAFVGCLALLQVLAKAEEAITKGGFEHYKNH
jgi:hypothetical protein